MYNELQPIRYIESESEEEVLFAHRGYRMEYKVCDTLQGELWKGEHMQLSDDGVRSTRAVAIKRVSKELTRKKISKVDDHGFTFCLDEDVVKEVCWFVGSLVRMCLSI